MTNPVSVRFTPGFRTIDGSELNTLVNQINAAGVGLPLIGTGATVTTSQPLLNLTQTWNNGAVTFTGLKLNVTDTASAAGSLLMDLQVGGVSQFKVQKDGVTTAGTYRSAGDFWASSNTARLVMGTSGDVILARDAANTLALRNGTAGQAFNVYNTYTDASNYERGYSRWNAGVFEFGMETAGTGTTKHTRINRASGTNLYLGDWFNNSSGHFLASVDNTYDIGANGANRPRNIYAGSNIYAVTNVGADLYTWGTTRSSMTSPVDGVIRMANNTQTNFTRLILGTNDTSGIAIKKNGTSFSFVLGDDSAFASVAMKDITTSNTTFLHATSASLANGAAAQVATMTNGPTAGNPTKWIAINDNGTTRYIPAW